MNTTRPLAGIGRHSSQSTHLTASGRTEVRAIIRGADGTLVSIVTRAETEHIAQCRLRDRLEKLSNTSQWQANGIQGKRGIPS